MAIRYYVDVQNRCLVESFTQDRKITTPPRLTFGDKPTLEFVFVKPAATPSATAPFEYYAIPVGATFKLGMKKQNPNAFEDPTFLAYQDIFANIANGKSCELELATSALDTYFATTDDYKETWLELEMTPSGGSPDTLVRFSQLVNHQVIDGAVAPTPTPQYYTKTEVDALLKGGNSSLQKRGATAIPNGASQVVVAFDADIGTAAWHPRYLEVVNTSGDSPKLVVTATIVARSGTGFTALLNAEVNSGNYVLEWGIVLD